MAKEEKYSFLEAKQKIEAWCAYRDRCHHEVYNKLRDFGLDDEDTNALLSHLIEYQFLDEQRFADSFVSGKHRMKKWGRNKIVAHLKQKRIPSKCIESALKEIDPDEYYSTLCDLAERKWKSKIGSDFEIKIKVQRYLANKGYEFDLIYSALEDLEKKTKQ